MSAAGRAGQPTAAGPGCTGQRPETTAGVRATRRRVAAGAGLGLAGATLTACAGGATAGPSGAPSGPPKQVSVSKTSLSTVKDAAWADTFAQAQKATGVT